MTKNDVKLILELLASRMSRNEIAVSRHMSKDSVSDVILLAGEQGITLNKLKTNPKICIKCFSRKSIVQKVYMINQTMNTFM